MFPCYPSFEGEKASKQSPRLPILGVRINLVNYNPLFRLSDLFCYTGRMFRSRGESEREDGGG